MRVPDYYADESDSSLVFETIWKGMLDLIVAIDRVAKHKWNYVFLPTDDQSVNGIFHCWFEACEDAVMCRLTL